MLRLIALAWAIFILCAAALAWSLHLLVQPRWIDGKGAPYLGDDQACRISARLEGDGKLRIDLDLSDMGYKNSRGNRHELQLTKLSGPVTFDDPVVLGCNELPPEFTAESTITTLFNRHGIRSLHHGFSYHSRERDMFAKAAGFQREEHQLTAYLGLSRFLDAEQSEIELAIFPCNIPVVELEFTPVLLNYKDWEGMDYGPEALLVEADYKYYLVTDDLTGTVAMWPYLYDGQGPLGPFKDMRYWFIVPHPDLAQPRSEDA